MTGRKWIIMKLSDKVKKLVDGKNFASVATLMPDGSPQVAPVWVDREGDTIVLNAARSRQRTKNLKRDPRVAICIFDQSNPYSNFSIRGKAVEITEKGAEEHIDKMNMKYHGTPNYPYHTQNDPRVLIRVEVTSIHEM
jgi:PPOX class probable F420-dependent enzyme